MSDEMACHTIALCDGILASDELPTYSDLRARLAAAESRLREYDSAGVCGYWHFDLPGGFTKHNILGARELIIRPRGGKGE